MTPTDLLDMPAKPRKAKDETSPRRASAETLAAKQRDISVSEFFAKNRHLLGFDNPRKALLTTVKEAVDNALDACEEAGILPDVTVVIEELDEGARAQRNKGTKGGGADEKELASERRGTQTPSASERRGTQSLRYRVTVIDNGPGIVRKQVEHIFGRLLYGSKFHRLKMSRGQQGIGISAAGMYGLLTTGRPMVIHTRPNASKRAHHIELAMNTKTNRAEVTVDDETDDFPIARLSGLTPGTRDLASRGEFLSPDIYRTGTSVSIELEGKYQRGRGSVDEFLELTAIANPHARITFVPPSKVSPEDADEAGLDFAKPKGGANATEGDVAADTTSPAVALAEIETKEHGGVIVFPRGVDELPPETKEIQPHPRGLELGTLLQMLKEAEAERPGVSLYSFLQDKLSRVSSSSAGALCKSIGLTTRTKVADVEAAQAERLFTALQEIKLPPPPTDCLAPIGVRQLLAGLLKGVKAEFYAASSRQPEIYRGRPFLIEAGIAFGGDLPADETARVIRIANRVPLQYQQAACSSFKAVLETNWRNYDLQQPRGSAPIGPLVIMIHMASVWVPFTSESKEAIADYDEIRKEMKLALQECGRKLGTYVRKRQQMKRQGERRGIFERYIGEVAKACEAITGTDAEKLYEALLIQARKRTAMADAELDDEGRVVRKRAQEADDDEGVVIVDRGGGNEEAIAAAASHTPPAHETDDGASEAPTSEITTSKKPKPSKRTKVASAKAKVRAKSPRATDSKPARESSKPASTKAKRQPPPPQASSTTKPKPPAAKPPVIGGGKLPRTRKPRMRLEGGALVPIEEQAELF